MSLRWFGKVAVNLANLQDELTNLLKKASHVPTQPVPLPG